MRLFLTASLFLLSLFSFSQVRISQVYGGGGNPAASYTNDFIELFNAGTTTADISNWSIQYASATGPVAPGNWAVAGIPAATSIGAGKYYLIALGSGGAVGIGLPTADLANNTINISNTTGKIALVNSTTPLNGVTACSAISVVDVIGYGASPSCFETAASVTTGIDNTMSQLRDANGCTDTNDNSNDFSIGTVNPRNSASAANACGPASATLFATPNILNITGNVGSISAERTFTLSGANLTGFPGNINLSCSPGLEVSLTSGAGFTTSLNIPYTSATLLATTIYVHFTAAVPQGAFTGTVTCSGGSAANAVVTITGGAIQNYYNTKANNGLNNTSTWSSTADGLGSSPLNFIMAYQLFNVVNQANANYTGVWSVTGLNNSSRVVVGDGVNPVNLIVLPGADSITMATGVDVLNNAILTIQNNRRPYFNNLAPGSTVDFAQTGVGPADTIRIPNISFYNLKLTGGLKYFTGNVTTIRGDLTADGVISMNGATGIFSTINALGDVSFINNAQFEPLPSGDAGRITLAMNGSGTQTITGDDFYLFRLQRDSTSSNSNIVLIGDTIALGNLSGGGLRLNQGASTTTILNIPNLGSQLRLTGGAVVTAASLGKINAGALSVFLMRSSNNTNAGVLRFTSGSHLTGFGMNGNPAFPTDSIRVADSVSVEYLGLTKGIIKMLPGSCLTVTDGPLLSGGHIIGGSTISFVEGKLRQSGLITDPLFPVGRGDKYAPVAIYNTFSEDITIEYFFNDFGNHNINPALLATSPGYDVSYHEYWLVNQNGPIIGPNPTMSFYYTDVRSGVLNPPFVKIAHFNGVDWDDTGSSADAANTLSNGVVGVNGYDNGPFTFSAVAAGVLPVRLTSFTVQKENKTVKLNWVTSQEINSSHFIIQRSGEGTSWTDIARVNAAGNSNTISNYNLVDQIPGKGINYYRLKQYDMNSRFDYSLVRTAFFSAGFDLAVTPNPAKEFINIYVSKNTNNKASISLTDMNGKVLKQFTSSNSFIQISTNGMAKGLYILKVIEGEDVSVKKVLLQ